MGTDLGTLFQDRHRDRMIVAASELAQADRRRRPAGPAPTMATSKALFSRAGAPVTCGILAS